MITIGIIVLIILLNLVCKKSSIESDYNRVSDSIEHDEQNLKLDALAKKPKSRVTRRAVKTDKGTIFAEEIEEDF